MSETHAPLQLYNLFKSFMVIFLIQAAIVLFAPIIVEPVLRFLILVFNVLISAFLGWRLYKRFYHMVFTYDKGGFTLKKGNREEVSFRWNKFSKVSLVRTDEGGFSVRLYDDSDFFDLPASKLKLNPFDFRLEVMRLVSVGRGKT
jgi:hypothetical protein